MTAENHSVPYGTQEISFRLVRSSSRKTLAIHVHPDMSVEVVAPAEAPLERIMSKVKERARWITSQVRYFEQFHPKTPARQYAAGETHRYLGRQYRLKVEEGAEAGVKLTRGYITVTMPAPKDPERTRQLLEAWFADRASLKFAERLSECLRLFPEPETVRPSAMIVRDLSARWGSMTPRGRLVLNRRLIEAPTLCIDYVIVHELCHRIYAHHGSAFWQLMERVMPDWEQRKLRLERVMS